jgi:hypothetical protein
MKLSRILFVVIILSAVNCFAQETKWTRIEFEKTVSVSVPDGFLVDVEKNDINRKYRIFNLNGNIQIWISVFKHSNSKNLVTGFRMDSNDSEKVVIDDIIIRRLIANLSASKSNVVLIGTKKFLYDFRILMNNDTDTSVLKFIDSIKIKGKPVFPQKFEAKGTSENELLDTDLKTSTEIIAALNRKDSESEDYLKIATFDEPEKNATTGTLQRTFSRQPFLINEAALNLEAFNIMKDTKESGVFSFCIKLRETGEIGEISVFTTFKEETIKKLVRAYRKLRFISPQSNGKNVEFNLLRTSIFGGKITPI